MLWCGCVEESWRWSSFFLNLCPSKWTDNCLVVSSQDSHSPSQSHFVYTYKHIDVLGLTEFLTTMSCPISTTSVVSPYTWRNGNLLHRDSSHPYHWYGHILTHAYTYIHISDISVLLPGMSFLRLSPLYKLTHTCGCCCWLLKSNSQKTSVKPNVCVRLYIYVCTCVCLCEKVDLNGCVRSDNMNIFKRFSTPNEIVWPQNIKSPNLWWAIYARTHISVLLSKLVFFLLLHFAGTEGRTYRTEGWRMDGWVDFGWVVAVL